jgi:hypothetical protein
MGDFLWFSKLFLLFLLYSSIADSKKFGTKAWLLSYVKFLLMFQINLVYVLCIMFIFGIVNTIASIDFS